MHKSRLAAFVIDTHGDDLNQAKQFWSKTLGQDCKEYDSINFSPINTPDDQPHIRLITQAVSIWILRPIILMQK